MAFSRTIIMLGCLSLGIAPFAHSATGAASKPAPPACNAPLPDDDTVSSYRNMPARDKANKLVEVAGHGAAGKVRALLAAGADADARNDFGNTALHSATGMRHVDVVNCLLAGGADVDGTNWEQITPLLHAANFNNLPMVRLLTAAGADPNYRHPSSGRTPLHYAAMNGYGEVAAALLEAGADKGMRDNEGKTPLDYAKRLQLIKLLIKN